MATEPAPNNEPAKPWWKSKTIWTALAAIVTALGAGASGQVSWPEAIQGVFAALLAIFIRDAVAKDPGAAAKAAGWLLVAVLVTGCAAPHDQVLIDSYSKYINRAGPKLLRYVDGDPALTEEDRQDWHDFDKTSRAVLEARKGKSR